MRHSETAMKNLRGAGSIFNYLMSRTRWSVIFQRGDFSEICFFFVLIPLCK